MLFISNPFWILARDNGVRRKTPATDQAEARALTRELDERFVATGILGVPAALEEQKAKPKGLGSRAKKESTFIGSLTDTITTNRD